MKEGENGCIKPTRFLEEVLEDQDHGGGGDGPHRGGSKGLNRRQPLVETAGPEPEYEIYAAKYGGPVIRKVAIVLWNVGWDEDGPINYYVWAIKAKGGEVILVDTGPSPAQGAARKVPGFVDPIGVVTRIGATGDSVSKVVITHMHWDHVGNIEGYLRAFPKPSSTSRSGSSTSA